MRSVCPSRCRLGQSVSFLIAIHTHMGWDVCKLDRDFLPCQGCQCALNDLPQVDILQATTPPRPPIGFPERQPLSNAVDTEPAITEDNQATKLCWSGHSPSHCQNYRHQFSSVISLLPRRYSTDIEIRLFTKPNATPSAPAPVAQRRRSISVCMDLARRDIVRCRPSRQCRANKASPQGIPRSGPFSGAVSLARRPAPVSIAFLVIADPLFRSQSVAVVRPHQWVTRS